MSWLLQLSAHFRAEQGAGGREANQFGSLCRVPGQQYPAGTPVQDRFAGDVGDFAKYALLNALAGDDLRLGVIWYLNPSIGPPSHGQSVNYSKLEPCDPDLYAKVQRVARGENRGVAAVRTAGVLPAATLFFEEPVDARERRAWFESAVASMEGTDLVFLDPDNGLRWERSKGSRSRRHVAFPGEVLTLFERGKSLAIYQHQDRSKGTFDHFVEQWLRDLREVGTSTPWALRFRSGGTRAFLVLPSNRHEFLLRSRAKSFIESRWSHHWKWVSSWTGQPQQDLLTARRVRFGDVECARVADVLCISLADYHAEPVRLVKKQLQWLGFVEAPSHAKSKLMVGDFEFRKQPGALEFRVLDYHAGPIVLGPQQLRALGLYDRRLRAR